MNFKHIGLVTVAVSAAVLAVVSRNPSLSWESAGTDEPGDQHADSVRPHSFWAIGPNFDGTWSVCLYEYEDSQPVYQDSAPNETTAKLLAWSLDPTMADIRP